MKAVTLRTAYAYDCEECGRENFVRATVHEFSQEEAEEMRMEHGLDIWDTGDWVTIPDVVTCQFCGAEFEAEDERDEC